MTGLGDGKRRETGEKSEGAGTTESPAARRRRIEKMREKRELCSLLDDFGDGDLDIELDLELEDDDSDEADARWVAADHEDEMIPDDTESSDEDDYLDEEFDEDD